MKINKQLLALGAAALAVAFFIGAWLLRPDAPTTPAPAQADLFGFVRSMDGTRPDGDIKVAEGDVLVVDAELGRLFEYYLSAVGEKPLDAIRAEIERELERRLKPGAAAQAKHLLTRYLDYKHALAEVEQTLQQAGNPADGARARLTAMQQTRSRFFSAKESEGLFAFEDAYNNDALARMEISQSKALSAAQKQEQLKALDAVMPPALREARDAPLKVIAMEESVQKMRAQGASDDEVYRIRAATFSPEAASSWPKSTRKKLPGKAASRAT